MPYVFQLLGLSGAPSFQHQTPKGKRLQKRPPGSWPEEVEVNQEVVLELEEDCPLPELNSRREDEFILVNESEYLSSTQNHHIKFELHAKKSIISDDESFYSIDEMQYEGLGRRAKTPVFMIGQLEKIHELKVDRAKHLAEEYQADLPPRVFTPFGKETPIRAPGKLRKIKCQLSLRDLVKDQAQHPVSSETESSDEETLIGSVPTTPYLKRRESRSLKSEYFESIDSAFTVHDSSNPNLDIGLKICTDMLTNELTSAVFKHQHVRVTAQSSELQILLLIKAYEQAQRQLQERRDDLHVTREEMNSVHRLLSHWLGVLYNVNEKAQERSRSEEMKFVELERLCKSPAPVGILRTRALG